MNYYRATTKIKKLLSLDLKKKKEFLLPLLIPGKGTVDLIYTAIYLLKLLFHTCIF